MPAQPRPTDGDTITIDNLLIGMPFIEFTPVTSGVAGQPVNLGVVDSAELQKELDELALESSQSGSRVTLRELITRIDPEFSIGVFNFASAVQQFTLGSSSLTPITANAAQAVSNEAFTLTTDSEDFLGLANVDLNSGVTLTPDAIVAEAVGTGDGLLGDVQGDFTLDFKVRAVADVTSVTSTNNTTGVVTTYTAIADGAAAAGNEVEVVVGLGALSGDLQFFVGGVAFAIPSGHTILASYGPSWGLTQPLGILQDITSAQADDGGVFTDETVDANSAAAADVILSPAVPATNDAFYVGMAEPFDLIEFVISTAAVGGTAAWEYFDGTSFVTLTNITDDTSGFTAAAGAHQVTFDVPADWAQTTVNSIAGLYWVRWRETAGGTSGATGSEVNVSATDEFRVDLKNGRIQVSSDATKSGSRKVLNSQPVEVTYDYNRKAHDELKPFTQTTFAGTARIRQLTDVGVNLIWTVPSAQIQVTDDALTFADDDFTVGTLTLKILDAGGTDRFGTLQVFSETQANV